MAKIAKKNSKSISAKEIKAWLRGIQEFQPEGWTPSKAQWDAIRDRIFSLDEDVVEHSQFEVSRSTRVVDFVPAPQFAPPAHGFPQISNNETYVAATPMGPSILADTANATAKNVKLKPAGDGGVSVIADPTAEGEYKSPF